MGINEFVSENWINKIEDNISKKWLLCLSILMLILLIISFKYEYNEYERYLGIVDRIDDNYVIKLYVSEDKMINFTGSTLLINNQLVEYTILSVSDKIYISESLTKGYEITIICDINQDDKVLNNILSIEKKLNKTTIMKKILNKIKKGLM